ncbi:DUF6777 domain-containing protein [Mycobacterium sp. OTB74]|uniref:DUF6777 domain-containing protein n=1 Tax=Mycobacterium sp. OTB74 TaxID=1853452 RepID=UPI002475B924|nr:DUF6777 domain-containing protein [Mycobacterium sp. OTB74]MDH6246234.1 hypothetical protein [Mycobacterium sp. OTB74]
MTSPPAGWIDPNPPSTTNPHAKVVLTIAGVALTAVVIATLVAVVVLSRGISSDSEYGRNTVVLIGVDAAPPDAFTPSAVVDAVTASEHAASEIATMTQQLPTSTERGVRVVAGTRPGLYGATDRASSCNAAAVANYLDSHSDEARVWSRTFSIEPQQVPAYLNTLTPVVLNVDAWVTAHRYANTGSVPFQTVLQAGTPVMIDPVGVPRVHCKSGSPLKPPANTNLAKLDDVRGMAWPNYAPEKVVAVAYSAGGAGSPVSEFSVLDLGSAEEIIRKVGGTIDLGSAPDTGRLPDPATINIPTTIR